MPPPLSPGYLTPHFSLSELTFSQAAERLGEGNQPLPETIPSLMRTAALLEDVRVLLGNVAVSVSSGYRSAVVNRAVGSDETSAHRLGLAADFIAPRFGTPLEICRAILASGIAFDQLIYEGTWVHIALAPLTRKPRREVLRAVFRPGQRTTYLIGLPQ